MLDEIVDRVNDVHRPALERLRQLVATADACSDLPRALVHPDPGPVNAITSADGLTLVDWTGAGTGPRVASLALLVSVSGGDLAGVDAIIDGYTEHIPVDGAEIDRFDAAMRIRPLFWACYYYRMSVQSGYTPTGAEGWWPQLDGIDRVADRVRVNLTKHA